MDPYKIITENGGPCLECIGRAMCINKRWGRLLFSCDAFSDYMIKSSGIKQFEPVTGIHYYYAPLNKHYTITKDMNGRVLVGKGDRRYGKRTM